MSRCQRRRLAMKRKRNERSESLRAQLNAAKAADPKAAAAAEALVPMDECNVLEGRRPGMSSGVTSKSKMTQTTASLNPAKSQGITRQPRTKAAGTKPVPPISVATKAEAWHTVRHNKSKARASCQTPMASKRGYKNPLPKKRGHKNPSQAGNTRRQTGFRNKRGRKDRTSYFGRNGRGRARGQAKARPSPSKPLTCGQRVRTGPRPRRHAY